MNQHRQKVFVIVTRFPYPLIKGDKLRAYHQIRFLSLTCDVYLCALSDEHVDETLESASAAFADLAG